MSKLAKDKENVENKVSVTNVEVLDPDLEYSNFKYTYLFWYKNE